MESARTHSFPLILIAFLFLALGFLVGFCAIHLSIRWRNNKEINQPLLMGGNTIMTKRMQAIRAAQKQGKDTYEFEVSGFPPILGNK